METPNFTENDFSRRSFISKTAAIGMGITLSRIGINKDTVQDNVESGTLNDKAKKLMAMFNLKYPIFQAPTGGAAWDALPIAVSNAGAMGGLPLSNISPDDAYNVVTKVKTSTKGSFFINYLLVFDPISLDKALEAGVSAVQFSWGMPDQSMVNKIRNAKAKLGLQVTSGVNAKAGMKFQPDYLVCQGSEAGGHVQGHHTLMKALAEVLEVAKDIPVVASGGIATGHDIRRVLNAGAAGAVLGTRFVATKESRAAPEYKNALVNAPQDNTVLTVCFDKGWPNALHRVLRNNTFSMWEAEGCPTSGKRPGEKDIVATRPDGSVIERYTFNTPREGFTGNITDMALYAGSGVSNINDIPSAGDLILRLWKEFQNK